MWQNKSVAWKFNLGAVAVFCSIFAYFAIGCYECILVNPFKKPSLEYWNWLLKECPDFPNRTALIVFAEIAFFVFIIVFAVAQEHHIKNLFRNKKLNENALWLGTAYGIAVVLELGWLYYASTMLYHYRLYMTLMFPTILGLVTIVVLWCDTAGEQ